MTEAAQEQRSAAEIARDQKIEALKREFPVGQLVECLGGDYPNNQGTVTGIVQKGLAPYVQVRLEVYVDGRRRPEHAQFEKAMRSQSLKKVDSYRDEPAPKAAPAPAQTAGETAPAADAGPVVDVPANDVEPVNAPATDATADTGW